VAHFFNVSLQAVGLKTRLMQFFPEYFYLKFLVVEAYCWNFRQPG